MIITAKEMRDIREGKGQESPEPKKLQTKKKSERDELFSKLKKAGIEYKGNMSNAKLKELLGEDK